MGLKLTPPEKTAFKKPSLTIIKVEREHIKSFDFFKIYEEKAITFFQVYN